MDYYLIINADGTKRGPLNAETPCELEPGQTKQMLTQAEADAYNAERLRLQRLAETPSCTQRQLRLWMLSKGITDAQVRAIIAQMPTEQEREAALIEYDRASYFLRNHPLIESLGVALGFTASQMDEGFREASQL